jgi:hypothetical protein
MIYGRINRGYFCDINLENLPNLIFAIFFLYINSVMARNIFIVPTSVFLEAYEGRFF